MKNAEKMKSKINKNIESNEMTKPVEELTGKDENNIKATKKVTKTIGDDQQRIPPNNYFIASIIVTLLCCPPTGVFGIINAARVERLFSNKQYEEAKICSANALKWIKISIGVALFIVIVLAIVSIQSNMASPLDILD